jgi:hypothetical protein
MYFDMKSYLKNTRNLTAKHTLKGPSAASLNNKKKGWYAVDIPKCCIQNILK